MTAPARQNRAADIYRFQANDDGQRMRPQYSDVERRAAMLTVAAHATDVADARLLLDMVGLLPDEASAPADDRRALGWRRT